MKAYRAAILRFTPEREPAHPAVFAADGVLVVGSNADGTQVVQAVGPYRELKDSFPGVEIEHLPGRIIAPGFVDITSTSRRPASLAHPPMVCCHGWKSTHFPRKNASQPPNTVHKKLNFS